MNKAIYLCLLLASLCRGQETGTTNNQQQQTIQKDTIMATAKFNIEEFNKHQKENVWRFTDEYGYKHYLRYIGGGYMEEISEKNNPMTLKYGYYLDGALKYKGLRFKGSEFPKGVWTYYDEKGNIKKQVDYDKPYVNCPWEKLKAYMESKEIDLMDWQTGVSRSTDSPYIWYIKWNTKRHDENNLEVIRHEEIDGNTGEVLLIYEHCYTIDPSEEFPCKKVILYDAKNPKPKKKRLGTPYTSVEEIPAGVYQVYKGVAYNKEDWKAFLKTLPWWERWF